MLDILDNNNIIATSAFLVALAAAIPSIQSFRKRLRDESKHSADLERLNRLQRKHELTYSLLKTTMSAIEENFSALWVISEESQRTGNLDVDRANIVISNYRKNMMKTIYHVGLFDSKEEALRSSWLLATEFGDVGTLELMIQFEEFWDEENQTTFLEHRAILQERLST